MPIPPSGRSRQFELDRSLRLALNDHGARQNLVAMGYIPHMKADQVAASQLAVDGQIEQGQVANRMVVLQVDTDRPDILGLEGWLLADQLALVPGFALV
jgi:hypothetical protein